jgi:ABC-type transport system substrate-binding protein
MLDDWRRGQEIIFKANPNYWGDAPVSETAVLRWSSEPGQKLIELQSGIVDGVDNPGPDDMEGIEAGGYVVKPRDGQNVLYLGMNKTHTPFDNVNIRKAIAHGVDKQRLVDSFYPAGSSVAEYFAPCAYDYACEGEAFWPYDPDTGKELLATGMEELGLTEFPENLGITATIDVRESTAYIDASDNGELPGIHLLGWNADYPDPDNFLGYHFGRGATAQFGEGYPELWAAIDTGRESADPAVRTEAYATANNILKENVPMIPTARGGSATVWQADVEGAHSSPLSNELFKVIGPGADDQLVFLQNGEPGGLYCADESDGESLRACEQIHESLYGFVIGDAATEPSLATECVPNEDSTVFTCTLRDGVTFHDGSTLDANDVVTSYAVMWDAANPMHVGRDGNFSYWSSLWGGFLNPPPAE